MESSSYVEVEEQSIGIDVSRSAVMDIYYISVVFVFCRWYSFLQHMNSFNSFSDMAWFLFFYAVWAYVRTYSLVIHIIRNMIAVTILPVLRLLDKSLFWMMVQNVWAVDEVYAA